MYADQAVELISIRFSTSIHQKGEEWSLWQELPLWQSTHSHCAPHLTPALKHQQQFFRHDDFLQVHLLAGTKAGTPTKCPGFLQFATCWAWYMEWQLPGWFWHPVQMQFLLQSRPFAKHSQYSLRQSIFVHLQPGWSDCYPSPSHSIFFSNYLLFAAAAAESGEGLRRSPSSSNSSKRSLRTRQERQSSSMRRSDGAARWAAGHSSLQQLLNMALIRIQNQGSRGVKEHSCIMADQKLQKIPVAENYGCGERTETKEKSLIRCVKRNGCFWYNFIDKDQMTEVQQLRAQAAGESQAELMLAHLNASTYFQHLRNTYPHFLRLSDEQRRNLVVSAEIFRVKDDKTTLLINYNQPTVSILVYGELRWGGRTYAKGSYFVAGVGQQQMEFLKKTAVLMLNRLHLQQSLKQAQEFYTKIDILERILPVELLGLQKRGYKLLNSYAEMHKGFNTNLQCLNNQQRMGIYVLYEGTFVVLSKGGIRLTQLSSDYFGEQTLWSEEYLYNLRPESYEYKYIFIPKEALLQILNAEMLAHLKDFFLKKQRLRSEIQRNYQNNLQFTQNFLKSSPVKKVKKRFTPEQIEEFNDIVGKMSRQGHRPKWKRQQDQLQKQRLQKLKQKRVYVPKKAKSKYFSTLTDNTFDFGYHQVLHQEQRQPYQPKLYLHQRAKTQVLFKRGQTSPSAQKPPQSTLKTSPTTQQKLNNLALRNSHRYYSHNYDRSYSVGMSNLVKMRKYDEMKKNSTLQRGQKILSLNEMTLALSRSFQQLQASMCATARDKKIDPKVLMAKTMRQTELLINKCMEQKGNYATWR